MSHPTDEVARAIARDGRVRVIAVRCDGIAQALMKAHDPGPTGAVGLSRVSAAALLMGSTLKGRQQVGLQFTGDGPLGELYAIADAKGRVRATVGAPQADVPLNAGGVDLGAGIGFGRLTVIRKLDEDAAPYTGVIPITHGTVAQDLAEYYTTSEQLPSAMALSERFGAEGLIGAAGLLVQMLPESDEGDAEAMEQALANLPPLSEFLASDDGVDALIRQFDPKAEIKVRYPVEFHCPCHRERYARALITLGVEQLTSMRDEMEIVEAQCHFCGRSYQFNREEMGALIYGATLDADKLAAWKAARATLDD